VCQSATGLITCCLQTYGGRTTLRNKLESTVIQQTKINTCNVQTHLESTVIQQTKESESLCRSRTSTSVPTPRTDASQAYRAATPHTGDRPSHTNNIKAFAERLTGRKIGSICNDKGGEFMSSEWEDLCVAEGIQMHHTVMSLIRMALRYGLIGRLLKVLRLCSSSLISLLCSGALLCLLCLLFV
jgi:hypothetical protein